MPRQFSLSTKTVTLAAALLLSTSSFSLAIEASEVAQRFIEFTKTQGQTISFVSIEDDNGDSFTMKGVSLAFPNAKPATVANIRFDGVLENSDGSVTINSVKYDTISFSNEQVAVSMAGATIQDYTLPSKSSPDAVRSMVYFSGMSGSDLKISVAGQDVASMANININYGTVTSDQPVDMNAEVTGVSLNIAGLGDQKFQGLIKLLGYDGKFTGQMQFGGSWNPVDGRMDVNKYNIQLDNVGTLSMLFTIKGYTAEMAKRLQDISKQANGSQSPQMAGMMMMQELPNLFFESARIGFTDDSITRRVLKMQAAQMGGSPDDVAKMVPVMLPLVLGGLGNAEFTTMVTGAVGRFVSEPGNIAISAKPAKPLAFSELMGIGMAAPTSLIGTLAVMVTANE